MFYGGDIINTKDLLNKYINDTFIKGITVIDESPFSSRVILPDGVISLLCLGNEIIVYIDENPYEKVVYNNKYKAWQVIKKY